MYETTNFEVLLFYKKLSAKYRELHRSAQDTEYDYTNSTILNMKIFIMGPRQT